MAKTRTVYLCRECGGVQSKWMGKCPDCGTWDALESYREPKESSSLDSSSGPSTALGVPWTLDDDDGRADGVDPGGGGAFGRAVPLAEVQPAEVQRFATGLSEFDRVLGGGLVRGSVVLIGGDPGIGKSTLLMQAAARISRERRVLYVSSEESAYQTRLRAERLLAEPGGGWGESESSAPPESPCRADELYLLSETNLGRVMEQARAVRPAVMIVDSIQMIYRPDVEAAPGSVAQIRRCCQDLVMLAKVSGMAVVLVGHVTKQGQIAGPKLIEHLVDTVLSFEGDGHHAHRMVRAMKNRFGATLEVAIFEMTGLGLREVDDRTWLFDDRDSPRVGSIICPTMHGSRCLPVEIQALTASGFLGNARRKASGLDANRLAVLIAVLERHGGLRLLDQDVFVSTTGGLKVGEPAADLALCLAIAAAHHQRVMPSGTAVMGEVGLGGEIRRVPQVEARLHACDRLGFRRVIVPYGTAAASGQVEVIGVRRLAEALELLDPTVSEGGSGGRRGPNPGNSTKRIDESGKKFGKKF